MKPRLGGKSLAQVCRAHWLPPSVCCFVYLVKHLHITLGDMSKQIWGKRKEKARETVILVAAESQREIVPCATTEIWRSGEEVHCGWWPQNESLRRWALKHDEEWARLRCNNRLPGRKNSSTRQESWPRVGSLVMVKNTWWFEGPQQ